MKQLKTKKNIKTWKYEFITYYDFKDVDEFKEIIEKEGMTEHPDRRKKVDMLADEIFFYNSDKTKYLAFLDIQ